MDYFIKGNGGICYRVLTAIVTAQVNRGRVCSREQRFGGGKKTWGKVGGGIGRWLRRERVGCEGWGW